MENLILNLAAIAAQQGVTTFYGLDFEDTSAANIDRINRIVAEYFGITLKEV